MQSFEQQLSSWKLQSGFGGEARRLETMWEFLAEHLFNDYEPDAALKGHSPVFRRRLGAWIDGCAQEEDRRTLFRLVDHLVFIGRHEMVALQQSALRSKVIPWLIEQVGIDPMDPDYDAQVAKALRATIFCPLTDSMRINAFFHVNGLVGQRLRPDFSSLAKLGDVKKVKEHLAADETKYLVLLEDFVGSGNQVSDALEFAALQLGVPVAAVPLVICHTGDERIGHLSSTLQNLHYAPVLVLAQHLFVHQHPLGGEPPYFGDLRQTINATQRQVLGRRARRSTHLTAYGRDSTGGLVVLYSNTPNNSVLLLHQATESWRPLFRRSGR